MGESFSTLNFKCDANADSATYADKTALDAACLNSYADEADTVTNINFNSDMTYDGVNSSYFMNNDTQASAIFAMAESMAGVTANDVSIENITDVVTTVRVRGRRLDTTTSAKLTYKIATTAEKLGFSSSGATEAFASLTKQISASVTTGNFLTLFKSAAASNGAAVPTTMSVPVSGVSFSEPEIEYSVTAPPTPSPTTQKSSKNNGDDDNGLSDGALAGIIIGCVVGFAIIVALVVFAMKSGGKGVGIAKSESNVEESEGILMGGR